MLENSVIRKEADASQEKRDEAPSESEPDGSLNFMEHLEEIRSRLIKTTIALLVVTALCATYADFLVNEILIGPLKRSSEGLVLQNLVPYGQVSLYFQVVFFAGFIISFPFIAWQIWQFVAPEPATLLLFGLGGVILRRKRISHEDAKAQR